MKLIKVFKTAKNLYNISNNEKLLKSYIIRNDIKISKSLFEDLISKKIKIYSYNLFNNLISKNISIITIEEKEYPIKMLNIYLPMICIYYYGSINKILNNKSVYLFLENTKSDYYQKIYNDFSSYLSKIKNINIIKFGNNKFFNKDIGIEIKYTSLDNVLKNKSIIKNDVLIINNKNNRKEYIMEVIAGISDLIIIPKARYNKFITILSNSAIEIDTTMVVCPGSIYSRETYFSNFLIKEGAYVLLNKKEIINYLRYRK